MRHFLGLLPVLALAGCMGGDTLKSWEGQSGDSLIYAWGPPAAQTALPDGRRVLTYKTAADFEGTTMHCEALFRLDSAGKVVSTEAAGTVGGCNRLLLSKPAAH